MLAAVNDTLLFNFQTDRAVLQKDSITLQKYANDWQLTFNVSKTCFLFNRRKSEINYLLCNQCLNNVDTHRYLYIELQSNLKWLNITIRSQARQAKFYSC